MTRLLVACMLLLGVGASNVAAEHLQTPAERLAKAYGCKAEVVTSDNHQVIESYYDWRDNVLYIGTANDGTIPESVFVIVILHEIGHCLQDQDDRIAGRDRVDVELEADMMAADMACQAGLDGRRMLHDAFVWAYETYGYEGDPTHGTLTQRIHAGYLAPSCNAKRQEAPFA